MAQPPPQRPPGIAPADWAALPLDIQQELSTPAAAAAAPTPAVISLLDDDDDGGGGKDEAQQLQRALQASAAEHAAAAAVAAGGGKAKTAAADEDEDEDEMIEVTVLPPKPAAAASARKRPRPTEEEQDGGGGGAAAISGKGKAKKKGGGASWVALRRGAEEGWVASRTQDSEWEEGLAEWRRLAQFQEGRTGAIYRDTEFCGMKSITGRESGGGGKKKGGGGGKEGARPDCRCGTKAKLCKVSKDGHNQGRSFWGCPKGRADAGGCGFFKWADDAPAQGKDEDVEFMRFTCGAPATGTDEAGGVGEDYCIVKGRGFRSDDVRQGGVGDCWFLSALAVVAERPDLINRVLLTQAGPVAGGMYCARLFIDGRWQLFPVDGYLALRTPKAGPRSRSDPRDHILLRSTGRIVELRYSKANDRQLWVPLIEKAYAKAHGSYKAISGGYIDEGMFDLTGLPTESIHFGAAGFQSELFWARLLSFQEQGFTMGASCPFSAEGLVGSHAYSILAIKELHDAPVGQQRKISDFFAAAAASASQRRGGNDDEDDDVIVLDDEDGGGRGGQQLRQQQQRRRSQGAAELPPYLTADGVLRLVRLRNPWGTREWTGSFGPGSLEWTPQLRTLLEGPTCKSTKGDGTFWMPWHDFLRCFQSVDVLKAHRQWFVNGVYSVQLHRGEFHPRQAIEVRVPPLTTNWTYLSIVQPTKRGKTTGEYWFTDLSLVVLQLAPPDAASTAGAGAGAGAGARAGGAAEDQRRVIGVQHLRLAGQGKVHHTELVLGDAACPYPSHYLLLPFSLNRWALHSDSGLRRGQVRERALEPAPFTVRVFSARPLELREVAFPTAPSPSAFLLEQLLRSLADRQLLRDSRFFAPPLVQAIPGAPGVTLTTYECTGAAVVVLENRNPAGYSVRARLVLHTGSTSDFGTSHPRTGKAGKKPPEWRVVNAGFKGVICALASPALAAHGGEEERELGHRFSMDGLEVEAVPEELTANLTDKCRGLFAWKRVV